LTEAASNFYLHLLEFDLVVSEQDEQVIDDV
jgi:hypothetical protein